MMVSRDEVAAAWRAKWQEGEGERCADVHGEAVLDSEVLSSCQSISPIVAGTAVGGQALGEQPLLAHRVAVVRGDAGVLALAREKNIASVDTLAAFMNTNPPDGWRKIGRAHV